MTDTYMVFLYMASASSPLGTVAGLNATPCRGVASHALGLQQWTETKAQIRMLKYLLKGPGHGP